MSHKSRLIGLSAAMIILAAVFFGWFSVNNGQIGLAQVGKVITVCASGCDFSKIQAAIDAAQNGSTIQVQTGSYKENLTIRNKDGLTLKGAGRDQVTIDGNGPQQKDITPGILILNSRNITVTGFKITNSRRGLEADDTTLLFIEASNFERNLRQGIRLVRSQAEIKGNMIQGNQVDLDASNGQGILLEGSQGTLSDNTITDNAECGVQARSADSQLSQASGSNNTIQNNKGGDLCGTAPTTLLAQPPPVGTLDQVAVPTDVATIQEAVNKAKAGGTITVGAGTYKEQVQIYKSVTIRGAGPDQTVVQAPSIEYVAINIATDQLQVTIEGLKVTGGRRGMYVATGPAGNITLRNVKFDGNGGVKLTSDAGLWIFEQATATLDTVSIVSNQGRGLMVFGQVKVTIQNSTIANNSYRGISTSDSAQLTIRQSTITGNGGYSGIVLFGKSTATIDGNTISGNAESGVWVTDSAQGTITNNQITGQKRDSQGGNGTGVVVVSSGRATIQGNTIQENALAGIVVVGSANATIDGNTVTRNAEEGIFVGNSAHAQITNNQITATKVVPGGGGGFGINLRQNAQATIQGNTISQNQSRGIILQESSQATIRQNTISVNNSYGISLVGNAVATIEDNTVTGTMKANQNDTARGIQLNDNSRATIARNRVTQNKEGGIILGQAAQATIQDNTISGNAANGIRVGYTDVSNETAQAEISRNTIQNNGGCGVIADNEPQTRITGKDNTISGNAGGQLCGDLSKFPKGFGGGK